MSPLAGRIWSHREVAKLLYEAGWTDAINLTTMVAVTHGESALYQRAWHYNDPRDALHPGDGSTDWGLLELNDGNVGGLAPDADGNPQPVGSKSLAEITAFRDAAWDPPRAVVNARSLYERRGFQPWAAYTNGSYKQFLEPACRGVANFLREHFGLKPV